MFAFMLKHFSNLVVVGVRADKGFKDFHGNVFAKVLDEYVGLHDSGTQVYNHLRKWHAHWVMICRLKELSRAHPFHDHCESERYNAYVKIVCNHNIHLCSLILIYVFVAKLTDLCTRYRITPRMSNPECSNCELPSYANNFC